MISRMTWTGTLALAAFAVGCSSQTATETTTAQRQPSAEGAKYLLSASPEGAQDVILMREEAADDQEVVVIGRIGGSRTPWIDGRAAFSVVDRSLAACSDIPGDNCPTPWDYCCETDKLPAATTLVKFVDAEGNLLATDARELFGLEELQTVVVKGKAQRDEAGNVTILASEIYVDPTEHSHHAHGDGEHGHDHEHGDHHDGHDHDHAEHPGQHEDDHPHGDHDAHDADSKAAHDHDHDHPQAPANEKRES